MPSRDSMLLERQLAQGGVPIDSTTVPRKTYEFCCPPVLHFGDAAREYTAAAETAAVFDTTDSSHIEITGKDAREFLHSFCTNDIQHLGAGQGCEAFITTVQGKIIAHVWVFQSEQSLWLQTTAAVEEAVLSHLDRYIINQDVQLHSRSSEVTSLLLSGPGAAQLFEAAATADQLGPGDHLSVEWQGLPVVIRRIDWLGTPGYALLTSVSGIGSLWDQLLADGVVPGGAQAYHAHRIEAGVPLSGLDLDDQNLAQEAARTPRAISFTKGCYLGQEPIARIDAMGHVNRELRILRCDQPPAPECGDKVIDEQGREIGSVTSSATQPLTDSPVALACLRRGYVDPGTRVRVRVAAESVEATVEWPESLLARRRRG